MRSSCCHSFISKFLFTSIPPSLSCSSLDHLLETKKAREFEQETELLLPATKQCRLCMKVPEEMDETAWHLFEDQIDEESLATHVFNFFQLQV